MSDVAKALESLWDAVDLFLDYVESGSLICKNDDFLACNQESFMCSECGAVSLNRAVVPHCEWCSIRKVRRAMSVALTNIVDIGKL